MIPSASHRAGLHGYWTLLSASYTNRSVCSDPKMCLGLSYSSIRGFMADSVRIRTICFQLAGGSYKGKPGVFSLQPGAQWYSVLSPFSLFFFSHLYFEIRRLNFEIALTLYLWRGFALHMDIRACALVCMKRGCWESWLMAQCRRWISPFWADWTWLILSQFSGGLRWLSR